MTHDEMIAVIQAQKDGKTIQSCLKGHGEAWLDVAQPSWQFAHYDYRVKKEPQTVYVIRTSYGVVLHCSAAEDFIREKKRKHYQSDCYSVVEFIEKMPS